MNQKNQYIFLDEDEDFFFDGEEQNFDEDYQSFRIVEIVGNKYLKIEDMTAYELLTETEEDKIDRENKENEKGKNHCSSTRRSCSTCSFKLRC